MLIFIVRVENPVSQDLRYKLSRVYMKLSYIRRGPLLRNSNMILVFTHN